jgi:hypothetical protein
VVVITAASAARVLGIGLIHWMRNKENRKKEGKSERRKGRKRKMPLDHRCLPGSPTGVVSRDRPALRVLFILSHAL